jgi:hypothetical protein
MTIQQLRVVGLVIALSVVAAAVSIASCAQVPPNVTPRTFQQAQKVDVVCMHVNDANGNALPAPMPVEEAQCAPVPANVNGATLPYHLYAVVTQTTPGELAVVDLTAGGVLDVDKSTPGIDFIPVGANPTDVAVAHDGQLTFVSSRDPNKMAIYAIDNKRLLGDSTGTAPPSPLRLTDLAACALPQPPQALAVLPMSAPDGGGPAGSYALVVLLGAYGGSAAAVATIDPLALASAAAGSLTPCTSLGAVLGVTTLSGVLSPSGTSGPAWPDGVPYADASGPNPVPRCPSPVGAGEAGVGDAALADSGPGDAGAPGLPAQPPHPTSMALRNDLPVLYVADDAEPVIHVIDLHDPARPVELEALEATSVADPTRRVSVGGIAVSPTTHDYKTYLYGIDSKQGTLMVYDITDPATSPHVPLRRPHAELNPLAPLDRLGFSAPVATVAFVEHDWPVSPQNDPIHQYTGLLCNPNPNANPEAGVFLDRGAYYRADQAALIQPTNTQGGTVQTFPTRLRGVFAFATLSNGNIVTIDVDDWDAPCRRPDPMAIGTVTDPQRKSYDGGGGVTGVLDLPEPVASPGDLDPYHAPLTYNSAIPESAAVTLEAFFPVSAPHRPRSSSLLRNDPITGVHVPNLPGVPQLSSATGAPVGTSVAGGAGGVTSPLLLPAPLPPGFIDLTYVQNPTEPNLQIRQLSSSQPGLESASAPGDPIPAALFPGSPPGGFNDAGAPLTISPPGVRVSFDDPTAHQDQDWAVTYEGALPTVGGIAADIASTPSQSDAGAPSNVDYETLTLSAPGARFCARGVEDSRIGRTRANQVLRAIGAAFPSSSPPTYPTAFPDGGEHPQPTLPDWTSDYVEIADDLLPASDAYWAQPTSVNECWPPGLDDLDPAVQSSSHAQGRYDLCQQTFGAAADADIHLARDLPILHARDDSLEVGRFGWFNTDPKGPSGNLVPEQTTNRVVVAADPGNKLFLRLTRCCFHHQATFKVRTGGEWVAVGSSVGLLHQVVSGADGSCVLSCDPRDALRNARAFDIPYGTWSDAKTCTSASAPTFDRDSPLAMRNPMFSFVMWSGCGPPQGYGDHTLMTRDLAWKFSMRGSFSPLIVPLVSASTGSAVSPQSMRFIGSLGQLAVVDGESQGLVLIDLNLVAVTRSYF